MSSSVCSHAPSAPSVQSREASGLTSHAGPVPQVRVGPWRAGCQVQRDGAARGRHAPAGPGLPAQAHHPHHLWPRRGGAQVRPSCARMLPRFNSCPGLGLMLMWSLPCARNLAQLGGNKGAAEVAELLKSRGVQLDVVVDEVRRPALQSSGWRCCTRAAWWGGQAGMLCAPVCLVGGAGRHHHQQRHQGAD